MIERTSPAADRYADAPASDVSGESGHAVATDSNPWLERYLAVRRGSEALAAPLSPEDQLAQSMPDASPTKWHLAHTTWFFETFVLRPRGVEPFDPAYHFLFNSYYEALGERQARPERGLITRPSSAEVMAYRRHVDREMTTLLTAVEVDDELRGLLDLGFAHEEQHQELILMDVQHLLSRNVLRPAYRARAWPVGEAPPAPEFLSFPGGLVEVGDAGEGFAFDNERPRHRVHLEPYRLADRPATNAEWLAFMADGGYRRAEAWLSDGWSCVQQQGWQAPLYWEKLDGAWMRFGLNGLQAVDPAAPVSHVSYYEADAFARWAGRRLPTEMEWEAASAAALTDGGFMEDGELEPRPRRAAAANGLAQMFGHVWEWTASPYSPYPGFRAAPGAVGEYNGKFMINQMVLRGGGCFTPRGHARASYRNFFHPHQRWQMAGVRLADD